MRIRITSDLEECSRLWRLLGPSRGIFDYWAGRMCFQKEFGNEPAFVIAEGNREVVGLLPLSRLGGSGEYVFFPGELWHGMTWLENNRFIAVDHATFLRMCEQLDAPLYLRYLDPSVGEAANLIMEPDEVNYRFLPARYAFSYLRYLETLSGRSRKKILREVSSLEGQGLKWRFNCLKDVELMFNMNLEFHGESSYFKDSRFMKGFEGFLAWLSDSGALTVTTAIVAGKVAAVDTGSLLGNCHTLLAGGVNPEFPGIAKLINLHHLQRACAERMEHLDFLCGDFGWKERFRLQSRQLYRITVNPGVSMVLPREERTLVAV